MKDKTKGIIAVVTGVVVLIIGTFLLVVGIKSRNETAFEFIKRKGAVDSKVFPGSLEIGGYRFFSNNRVGRLSDNKMGSYTKKLITWDDGTTLDITTFIS